MQFSVFRLFIKAFKSTALWSSHKISHFTSVAAVFIPISFIFVADAIVLDALDDNTLSIVSVDEVVIAVVTSAKIGVMAHEPALLKLSWDSIIVGGCTSFSCFTMGEQTRMDKRNIMDAIVQSFSTVFLFCCLF